MKHLLVFWIALFSILQAQDTKTLVLILYSENHPLYPKLQHIWRSYMHLDPEHFECYFLRSNPDLSSDILIEGDTVWAKCPNNLIPGLLDRTLLALEAFQPRWDTFDYVLRTNISSFYVFPRLLHFLQSAPKERLYCGIHHGRNTPRHPAGWVCGAGVILSKDMAQLLLDHKEELFSLSSDDRMHVDDVAMGDFFACQNISIQSGDFYREIYGMSIGRKIFGEEIPNEVFHFRINTNRKDRAICDFAMHYYLLQIFYPETVPTNAHQRAPGFSQMERF